MSGMAIELRGLTKRYGERVVLDNINATIPAHQTTVLLGPSGSGKSTLLQLITGLQQPDAGEVILDGATVHGRTEQQLRALRQRCSLLFQDNALFTGLSVFDNVAFPLRHIKRAATFEVNERVHQLLDAVGLAGLGGRSPDQLSGGQRKRVALARALALDPEVVLFDEPTSGLDPQTSATIEALIRTTQQQRPRTFLVITHDVESARSVADQVGLLWHGKLEVFAPAQQAWQSTNPVMTRFVGREPLG
jgi:phospholipid/cholesterol/gamma-HCH transport system ATP-binding protein